MDFGQAQSYLIGTINETVSRREPYRLDRMRALLRELGDPQDRYPTVHVGGTSGKGSTSTMMATVLSASGKRTGLHTKPHLRSMVERARVDGANVSESRFAELLEEMLPAIDRAAAAHGRPSYYETLLALAFLHFFRERVDVAVIEVGIGGRLDGTNVIVPKVSIITNVGLDHTDVLGDTLEKIASDKVGIAKPGVPLISAVEDPGARRTIEAGCARAGAPFLSVLDTVRVVEHATAQAGQRFSVTTPKTTYEIALPVLGTFQQGNAATAILALEQLPEGLRPDAGAIERGLAQVALPGRMEYFPSHPPVIFDIAHNPDKAAHLVASLRSKYPDRRFSFVIAVSDSKDAHEILRSFVDLPATFIFSSFDTEGRRATKPQRLASIAEDLGIWGRAIADPIEALAIARRNAASDEVVVVTGSTFVVSQLREWWVENVVAQATAL
ncbi:MAG TPA: folylpolyglutamate synthase/dihydrofolate synthase family protein [Candidatus Baltobacteraceae bacterium]|jgi:dihydrofolate synthase/folylpolyglutamate synthase